MNGGGLFMLLMIVIGLAGCDIYLWLRLRHLDRKGAENAGSLSADSTAGARVQIGAGGDRDIPVHDDAGGDGDPAAQIVPIGCAWLSSAGGGQG